MSLIFPSDELFMQRCFDLALNGMGNTAPNPMVGAVIVSENKIIGEGFHEYFGGPHAEVNAIRSVKSEYRQHLKDATIYVSLEPCCYHGKTPPCTDLILQTGIKKIVTSTLDPNPLVAGKGLKQLENAGCEIRQGILENKGAWLNRRFITFHQKTRPYIILKWAQSADGFFTKDNQSQHWLTSEQSKRLVHRWRSEEMAVLAGTNTIAVDNPQLTNRFWLNHGKQPWRVVIDKTLRLPADLKVFKDDTSVLIFNEQKSGEENHLRYRQIPFDERLAENILRVLIEMNILSVIIEGGFQTLQSFITRDLWDEARIFTAETHWGKGLPAPALKGEILAKEKVGTDTLTILINQK